MENVEAVLAAADAHAKVAFGLAAYAGQRAGEVVGLRWVTRFHDLRHFFITQCFAGGAGGPTVQRLAGHCHPLGDAALL